MVRLLANEHQLSRTKRRQPADKYITVRKSALDEDAIACTDQIQCRVSHERQRLFSGCAQRYRCSKSSMAQDGVLVRIRGGAKAANDNPHLSGEAIMIDGGSTTLQMCPHLISPNLQVLTNSLHIVNALLPQAGAAGHAAGVIPSPETITSTRRLRARPSAVALSATGFSEPRPSTLIFDAGTPCPIR